MDGQSSSPGAKAQVQALKGAVHDASNSLTVLLGWLERAAEGTDVDRKHALSRAREHALHARHQMRHAIGDDSADPSSPASMTAEDVIASTVEDLEREASQAQVRLCVDNVHNDQAAAVTEPVALGRVLTNLLLNAISVSDPTSEVHLVWRCEGEQVLIEVRDDGPGIAPSRRATLFSEGVTTRKGGAGVGLCHASEVSTACGGTLSLKDDGTPGACFEVIWPASKLQPRPSVPQRPRRTKLDGLRMLMLEDDVAIKDLLELSLPARGAALQTVETLADLHQTLSEDAFDVLLMDLSPVGDQLDATLSELRAQHPQMRLIVTSGSVTVALRDDVRWLRKPFTPDELATTIRRELSEEDDLGA